MAVVVARQQVPVEQAVPAVAEEALISTAGPEEEARTVALLAALVAVARPALAGRGLMAAEMAELEECTPVQSRQPARWVPHGTEPTGRAVAEEEDTDILISQLEMAVQALFMVAVEEHTAPTISTRSPSVARALLLSRSQQRARAARQCSR